MILVDKENRKIEGDVLTVTAELASFWGTVNEFLDESPDPEIFEEFLIQSDTAYKSFCQLAVRLNEAHKRAVDRKKRFRDISE